MVRSGLWQHTRRRHPKQSRDWVKTHEAKTRLLVIAFLLLGLGDENLVNKGLTFRNQGALVAWQFAKKRQFHSLHCRLDSAQGVAVNQNLVRGEDQSKLLLFPTALEFREGELVEWQQQTPFSRHFDSDAASVRIARPTFG